MRKTVLLTLAALIALPAVAQQLTLPRTSQKATLSQTIGLTTMTISYSRPGVKGRQIWGSLVPYDNVWRTGANEATTVTFTDDVTINGQKLPKGTYAFFTIPGRDQWALVFNSQGEQWGAFNYDQTKDVARFSVKPEKGEYREWMEFEVPEVTTDTAKVVLRWENVAVPFTVNTGSTDRALASAKQAIGRYDTDRWQLPYRAADFAFQNNRMDEAKLYLDQALKAANENMATLWLKARMQQKAGDKAAAIKTAELALTKATDNDRDFAADIRKTVDRWRQ